MIIEMKRRDSGHKNERWMLDLREKAVLIDPAGKAVLALEPLEALSRFRMPSFGGDTHGFQVLKGNIRLTFSVAESDLRQIAQFLNQTPTATRRERNPVKAVLVALGVLAGLGAFALLRAMDSGTPPAPALAQNAPSPVSPRYTQDQSPRTPVSQEEQVPASQPRVQVESPPISAIPAAVVRREEAIAIEGLRECALFTGQYPKSLATSDGHLNEIIRQMRASTTAPAPSTPLDAGPARTRSEKIVCICRLMSFYVYLCGNGKEPVYYGEVVKPGEADRVLLRWRLTPNEYRVVYGDLRAETISPDRLARLEATLPR